MVSIKSDKFFIHHQLDYIEFELQNVEQVGVGTRFRFLHGFQVVHTQMGHCIQEILLFTASQ